MRASTRRRITLALIGLLVLVLLGWFVQDALAIGDVEGSQSRGGAAVVLPIVGNTTL